MTRSRWYRDPFLWVALLVGAAFLYIRLGQQTLWQDEAETAILARNLLRFGYPKAFDGLNLVWDPQGYGPNFAWIYHPWGTFYLTALSFKLCGISTLAARAPCALLGWLTILLTYRLARAVSPRVAVARWAAASVLACVPFLLFMRQCRYYAPSAAFGLWWLLAYHRWISGTRWSLGSPHNACIARGPLPLVVVSGVVLFHMNHGTAMPFFAAAALHWWLFHRRHTPWREACTVAGGIGVLTLPWFWYLHGWRHAATQWSWVHLRQHAEFYVRMTNKYVVPLAWWGIALGWRRWRTGRWLWHVQERPDRILLRLLYLVLGVTMVFVLLPEQRHVRYLVPLMPLWLILQALLLDDWVRHRRWQGCALAAVILGTTILSGAAWRVPLLDFGDELAHDYHGPNEAIVTYLHEHAHAGERVKTPYDERVLMFYTPLTVERPDVFLHPSTPEWIVPRQGWLDTGFWESPYGRQIRREYDAVTLAAVDLVWDNRPDPNEHHVRTVTNGPRVVIYRRRETP